MVCSGNKETRIARDYPGKARCSEADGTAKCVDFAGSTEHTKLLVILGIVFIIGGIVFGIVGHPVMFIVSIAGCYHANKSFIWGYMMQTKENKKTLRIEKKKRNRRALSILALFSLLFVSFLPNILAQDNITDEPFDYCKAVGFTDEQIIDIITGCIIVGMVALMFLWLPSLISIGAASYGIYKIMFAVVTVAYYWIHCKGWL